MKMNRLFFVLVVLMLSGCSLFKPEPEVVIREVEVPLIVYADVLPAEVEPMQRLPIYDLNDESSEDDILIAITESIVILESYRKELEEAIRPFNNSRESVPARYRSLIEGYITNIDRTIDNLSRPIRLIQEEKEDKE